MPTKSGRLTAQEKRDKAAAQKRAEQDAQGVAYDLTRPGWSDAEAAAIKAESDAGGIGVYAKRTYLVDVEQYAVAGALKRLDVKYPDYVLWTSESFMLFGGGPHEYTVEVVKQDADAIRARWKAEFDRLLAEVRAEKAAAA